MHKNTKYVKNKKAEETKYFKGEKCKFNPNDLNQSNFSCNHRLASTCFCKVCSKINMGKTLKYLVDNQYNNLSHTLNDRIAQAENDRKEWNGGIMKVSDLKPPDT